ncbi:MAG: hypothetical protein CMP68_00990 [Flavobacteriales bacterium]|nr:hypothetical protein [Flavobacteriales bacterium]
MWGLFIGFSLLFLFWKLSILFAYLFISIILAIVLNPLNKKLQFHKLNRVFSSLICILIIFLVIFMLGFVGSPIILDEIETISKIDYNNFQNYLNNWISDINDFFKKYNINSNIKSDEIFSLLNFTSFTSLFAKTFSLLGNVFLASFSICFITFFLLKDTEILKDKFLKFISNYILKSEEKLIEITYYLRRYFTGLITQLSILFICYGIGMDFLNIQHAWVIALFAAIINIIPYVGPIIGFSFASIIIITTTQNIDLIPNLLVKTFILFAIIQNSDNFIFQPMIFSKILKIHPLEIFTIVLAAGMLGGIVWMLLAIPSYAVIKILAGNILK